MKKIASLAALVLAIGTGGCSSAPPAPVIIHTIATWSAPASTITGEPIRGPLTYRIYAGPCGQEKLIGMTMSLQYEFPAGLAGCAYATAVDEFGQESAPSMRAQLGLTT